MSHRTRLAICMNRKDREPIVELLDGSYEFVVLRDSEALKQPFDAEVLIVELLGRDPARQWALSTCRQANPGLPMLLMARNMDPDLAVEVVKLVGNDFLALPMAHKEEVGKKIARLLRRSAGATLGREWLVPLGMLSETKPEERRGAPRRRRSARKGGRWRGPQEPLISL